MKIVIAEDRAAMGKYTAHHAAMYLRKCLAEKAECNIVVATGSSQFEVLDSLVKEPGIEWNRVNGFHLDEYLGLHRSHSASFCGYLASRFVERVPLKSFFYLDGTKTPEELKAEASHRISGVTIDLMLCGIGENAHLAFNDPPANFTTQDPYLIVDLDEACRKQQVGEGWFDSLDEVPTQAISMSIHQILTARKIYCSVPDGRKAQAVRDSVEGEISPMVPATALRNHGDVTLVLDSASSTLLAPTVAAQAERA
jgi:glucosamine-6-phosphate deaminase